MSYKKPRGLWVSLYGTIPNDPRTQVAAEYLVSHGVARYAAVQVVMLAWARLHCYALSEGNTGYLGHIPDHRLAEIAWPESACAPKRIGRGETAGRKLRETR